MNIHASLSEAKKKQEAAQRALREALFQSAVGEPNPGNQGAIDQCRKDLQQIEDRITGLEEAARIDAQKQVERKKVAAREKLKEAISAALKKVDERLQVQREIAQAITTIGTLIHSSEALAYDALRLIQEHLPQREFLELKDSAVLPSLASEPEMIVHQLAAHGLPVPGIPQVEATSYVALHHFASRVEERAERIKSPLNRLISDAGC